MNGTRFAVMPGAMALKPNPIKIAGTTSTMIVSVLPDIDSAATSVCLAIWIQEISGAEMSWETAPEPRMDKSAMTITRATVNAPTDIF